jgi:hypothetical protein
MNGGHTRETRTYTNGACVNGTAGTAGAGGNTGAGGD